LTHEFFPSISLRLFFTCVYAPKDFSTLLLRITVACLVTGEETVGMPRIIALIRRGNEALRMASSFFIDL
jgi:hypothetical protein